jgi:hypothetical protein
MTPRRAGQLALAGPACRRYANITAQVAVRYMACKTDGVCLRPVEREILDIQIKSR